MVFSSLAYIVLFSVTFGVVHALPVAKRWIPLLVASYVFYGYGNFGIALLLLSMTVMQFCCALAIENTRHQRKKRVLLTASVLVGLLPLIVFKYAAVLFGAASDLRDLVLPIGISFFTFQLLGYVIDVYRGAVKPEKHFGKFAVFIAFFPQLVAGPIERASHLLPQIAHPKVFDYDRALSGLRIVLWGFFKKLVIADRIARMIDPLFAAPETVFGWQVIAVAVLFFFQIYCDFSGYVDIAMGSARMLGIDLTRNFRLPYCAVSVRDFWRRWHITLFTWLRDYLYIPLGGNRVSAVRWCGNVLFIFLVSGLWHGAGWTFALWGVLHGMWICLEQGVQKVREKMVASVPVPHVIPWLITLMFLCATFLLFRAPTIGVAAGMFHNIAMLEAVQWNWLWEGALMRFDVVILSAALPLMIAGELWSERFPHRSVGRLPIFVQWSLVTLMVLVICNIGVFEHRPFIYFQF